MRTSIVVAFAAASIFAAASAHAFCRTTTVRPGPDATSDCPTEGVPLYQPSTCFAYHILTGQPSPKVPDAVLSDGFARAFAAWSSTNPTCAPGISAIELAPVQNEVIANYEVGEPAHNVIGVIPTWTHGGGEIETLALSTLSFDATTGEVLDVDTEINGQVAFSFTDVPPQDGTDFFAVAAHEAGHILGLGHSDDPEATMYAAYAMGSVKQRDLNADDQKAICTTYPSRTTRATSRGIIPSTACNLAPGSGSALCDTSISHGCDVGPAAGGPAWLGGLFVAIALVRRRRHA